ncbi:MAG: hypothetical protein ACE5GX_17515 [Thermoanaerobaculia bacterium]
MTSHRSQEPTEERDTERLLRRFFAAVHADDRVPAFQRMARPALTASVRRSAAWRPVFAVLAVVVLAAGVAWLMPGLRGLDGASLSETEQLALAQDLSSWEAPLDFLLETPGREILYAPPSFELMETPTLPPVDSPPVDRPAESFGETEP